MPRTGRIPSQLKTFKVREFGGLERSRVRAVIVICPHRSCNRSVVVTLRALKQYAGKTRPCFHCFKTSIIPKELTDEPK